MLPRLRAGAASTWLTLAAVACTNTNTPPSSAPSPAVADAPVAVKSAALAAEPPTAPTETKPNAPPVVDIEPIEPVVARTVSARKPSGRTATFKWGHGSCENTATFDKGRFSAQELEGTVKLFQASYVPILDQKSTRASLEHDFQEAFDALRALTIVPEQPWETYRATKMTQARQRYRLALSELEFRTDPSRLRAHPAYPACRRWADPLIAGDEATVLVGWRALAVELAAKPGASSAWREVAAASTQPGAATRARAELLAFGWHNCVNDLTIPLPFDEREFDQLLIAVKRDCDH